MSNHRRIHENVARVRGAVADAAARSGRDAGAVTLVGVTKYVGPDEAAALIEAGLTDLGESRPQELWSKAEALQELSPRWHLIGHLQRNKAARTIKLIDTLHSGDSLRLLKACDAVGAKIEALIEVNISGDEAKHGFSPEDLAPSLEAIAQLDNLKIIGFMAMASRQGGREQARRDFVRLRELRDQLAAVCPAEIELRELSMGMSGDFDIAIEEGATMVRLGSTLFEGVV